MIEHPATGSKPPLDEESFTRLLAAAYVMQEHRDGLRTRVAPADLTEVISQVVQTQHEIRSHALDCDAAFELIAKRLCSVSGAAGVAIATLEGDNLKYCAGAGVASVLVNSVMPAKKSLASSCLKTGNALQSPLAQSDPRLDSAQCRKLGAQSLLALPLYHDGRIAGSLEIFFSQVSGFGESETRAAELMAGVVSEVMAESAERELKEELESERSSVLQALEMLEPELQKLSAAQNENETSPHPGHETELCRACGHTFAGNESACGVCGASRDTGMYPGAALQSKWAVLWEQHLTGADHNGMPLFRKTPPRELVPGDENVPPLPKARAAAASESAHYYPEETQPALDTSVDADLAPAPVEEVSLAIEPSPWNSAQETQEWLSIHRPEKVRRLSMQAFRARPGDASLVLASLVLLITLIWAFWPGGNSGSLAHAQPPAMAAIKRRPRPKPPQLTLFERTLVGLGLAVPPPTPEYMGDPNVKVWEDLQTALYYCPTEDLYGTTAKGRYTTQADAQQDAFEPAFKKPCD